MSEEAVETVDTVDTKVKQKLKGAPETTEDGVIGSSGTQRQGGKKTGKMAVGDSGAIGSRGAEAKPAVKKSVEPKPKVEKVAVHSTKNASIAGFGTISKGYNIYTPEKAEKWLTYSFVREATPEEVAKEFGL